jgi:hypothetical protein
LEAYYNAQMQQDAQLAAGAQQAGQQQYAFGQGLFGAGAQALSQYQQGQVGAYDPYKAAMAGVTQLESLGQQPFQLGMDIGSKNINATGANALYQGGVASAGAAVPANQYNPFASVLTGAAQNPAFTSIWGNSGTAGSVTNPYSAGSSVDPYTNYIYQQMQAGGGY